jgi:hypothetical protein
MNCAPRTGEFFGNSFGYLRGPGATQALTLA